MITVGFNFLRKVRYFALSIISRVALCVRGLATNGEKQTLVLLALGASKGSPFVARSVLEAGYRLVVCAPRVPMYEGRYASKWIKVDPQGDYDTLLNVVKNEHPLAVLVEQRNILLPVKARLNADIGFDFYGQSSYITSNSKVEFRKALSTADVPNIPWCLLEDLKDSKVSFPLIFKPEKGTGSRGIRIVNSDEDLQEAIAGLEQFNDDETVGGRVLLEELVEGRQFDVEGVYQNGKYSPLAFIEEHYDIVGTAIPSAWYLFNPPVSKQIEDVVYNSAEAFTQALGVNHGAFHCEMKVTSELSAYAIDYSNRMGYPHLVSEACGQWFPELYVRVMAGERLALDNLQKGTVFQEYIRTEEKYSRYKQLLKKYPKMLVQRNIHFVTAGVPMRARVALKADSYEHISNILDEFNLVPVQWEDFYKA